MLAAVMIAAMVIMAGSVGCKEEAPEEEVAQAEEEMVEEAVEEEVEEEAVEEEATEEEAVPTEPVVVGVPGRVIEDIREISEMEIDLEHGRLPDPVANAITCILHKIDSMETTMNAMGEKVGMPKNSVGNVCAIDEKELYQEFGEGDGI